MTTIKNGSRGDEVKVAQILLNSYKNYGLVVDGIFGTKLTDATKDFQKNKGLSVDGIIGPKTWTALGVNNTMNTLRNGSKGDDVKTLQTLLNTYGGYGLTADGIFGAKTESAVKAFQKSRGLIADGIVGTKTWAALGITASGSTSSGSTSSGSSSSGSTSTSKPTVTPSGLVIDRSSYLSSSQYVTTKSSKDFIVLHHTAGWDNPYNTISSWNRDSRGRVATEFVLGGIKCTTGETTYDGKVVAAFPEGYWGYHIGSAGTSGLDKRSVGIETCNFGHVKDGKNYAGSTVQPQQIVTLSKKFRGYNQFHRYSDKQLEELRKLILYICNRDNIDAHKGIYEWIKKQGVDAFEFQSDAYYGKVKGIVTHANIRKDKEDMFPQPELIDMILSL